MKKSKNLAKCGLILNTKKGREIWFILSIFCKMATEERVLTGRTFNR